jgi:hypothetical protein
MHFDHSIFLIVYRVYTLSNIHYDQNASNVPQVRLIEKYWALCKVEY